MTTLENRPNTALLVVDVQNGVVEGAHERDAVVANVGSLVEKARRERVPVVWVQHSGEQLARGSDDWHIVRELTPGDAEPLIAKNYGDSFEDTTLETVLSGLAVGRLVVVGAETDACIRSTLHGAFVRGYDATLVSDAHTTGDQTAWGAPPPDQVIAHTNLYWTYHTAPGRTAGTVETKDVDFRSTSWGLYDAEDPPGMASGRHRIQSSGPSTVAFTELRSIWTSSYLPLGLLGVLCGGSDGAAATGSGHHALVPPLDRRAVEGALFGFPLPMIGGALVAAGATTAAVVVLSAAVMVAIAGGVRVWRTRP